MRIVSEASALMRRKKGLCIAWGCTCKARKNNSFCYKHLHVRSKEINPLGYCYQILRSNARRRAKEFTLTIEQFREFCERTGYLELKGKLSGFAHIDRIDPRLGYCAGNIQIMEASSNCRKNFVDQKIIKFIESGNKENNFDIWETAKGFEAYGHEVRSLCAEVTPF